ncbi:hypothetical protein MLD38_015790 [Melastoma candidum]|uniref:Uncharacterized protein n=1 Tax=Melastoma candidum TaxID=119954 RepID=A0ACB9RIH5_9MYRT|nr:hypothetical protein MLD38_015790 [Melastoma candidum]
MASDGYMYLATMTRPVRRSKSAGHAHWRPALSAISEDGVPNMTSLSAKKPSSVRKDKRRVRSQSINTGNLYSWRFLLESSPAPFVF